MTNRQLPALSRAETRVLARLWDLGRASVQDVRHNLPGRQKVAYATVQTLLRRLEKKGYVTHDAEGKAHVFQPAVPRDAVVKRSVADFVDRLFGGDPVPLLLHLADHSGLDAKDIQRLRRLLEKNSAWPHAAPREDPPCQTCSPGSPTTSSFRADRLPSSLSPWPPLAGCCETSARTGGTCFGYSC